MSKYHMIVLTSADDAPSFAHHLTELWNAEGIAARVVTQGVTDKMNQGILIIEWDDLIPYKHLHQLNIENDIVDYIAIEHLCQSGKGTSDE